MKPGSRESGVASLGYHDSAAFGRAGHVHRAASEMEETWGTLLWAVPEEGGVSCQLERVFFGGGREEGSQWDRCVQKGICRNVDGVGV